jgi:hypothetical protein
MSVALTTRGRICPGSSADALVTNGRICLALGPVDLTRVDTEAFEEISSVIAAMQELADVAGGLHEIEQVVIEGSIQHLEGVVATLQTIDTIQLDLEEMLTGAGLDMIDEVVASVEEIDTVQGNFTEIEDAEATIDASVADITPTAGLATVGELTATIEEFDE